MGLPRPYGQFVATRGGDGLAVFERLPPHRGPGPSHSSAYPLNTRNDDAHELASPPTDPIGSEGGLQSVEVPVFKSKSGLVLPMASRLKSSDLPENIRIDCGYGLTKSFMASRLGVALSPVKSPSSQQTKEAKESGAHTWAMTSMTEEEERRMEETVEMLTAISVGGSREGKVVDSTLAARNRASALPLEHTLPRRNTKPGK